MTQEKMRAETERDDDCSCHARALDYGETTLPRAICTDALRQHEKRDLDKFPIPRAITKYTIASCYFVPNEAMIAIIVNQAISRICSQSKPRRGRTAETRENGRGRSVRHRSHARVQAPLPPPPPQISYAHRTYIRLETASFGPNDSDPGARVKLGAVKSE